MKQLIILLALVAFAAPASAQLEKGNILIGGTGSFSAGGGTTGFAGSLSLNPRAGLFLTNRLVVGVNAGFDYSTFRPGLEGRVSSYGTSIQPYVRYYFSRRLRENEQMQKVVPFAELGGGFNAAWFRGNSYFGNSSSNGATAYGMLGVNWFLNRNVALEANLSYRRSTDFSGDPFFRQPGLGGGIGFQIFLNRGAKRSAPSESGTSDR